MIAIDFILKCSMLFQVCGICVIIESAKKPFDLNNRNKENKLKKLFVNIWLNLQLLLIILIIYFVYYHYYDYVFYKSDAIGNFGSNLELIFPILTHFIIVFETIYYKNLNIRMNKTIEIIDNIFIQKLNISLNNCNRKFEKKYITSFILIIILTLSNELLIICAPGNSTENGKIYIRNWCARFLSINIGRIALFQYILYVHFMTNRLNIINNTLKSLQNQYLIDFIIYKKKNVKNLNKLIKNYKINNHLQLCQLLNKMKLICNLLGDLTIKINRRFGWSILASMTNFFVCITIDLYWVYVNIHFGAHRPIGYLIGK